MPRQLLTVSQPVRETYSLIALHIPDRIVLPEPVNWILPQKLLMQSLSYFAFRD